MRILNFHIIEILIILFGISLFSASSYIYTNEISLRKKLFGWQDETALDQVGLLSSGTGLIRRKTTTGRSFALISSNAQLYNLDTIVTGPAASARITMSDGSEIELGPKTMIKLEFESNLSLQGISRTATVNVVSGKVQGRSKKQKIILKSKNKTIELTKEKAPQAVEAKVAQPTLPIRVAQISKEIQEETEAQVKAPPVKAPVFKTLTSIQPISPRRNASLTLPSFSEKLEKEVLFKWKTRPRDGKVQFILKRRTKKTEEILIDEVIDSVEGQGEWTQTLTRPGSYSWELKDPVAEPKKAKRTFQRFVLRPTYEGLKVRPPLVGGKVLDSNRLQQQLLKDFDITLRWKANWESENERYRVNLYKSAQSKKPIFTKVVSKSSYVLNKNKVFSGQIFYEVLTNRKNGFIASSGRHNFQFSFLPPSLVNPKDSQKVSLNQLYERNSGRLIFTWGKTNFTQSYRFELASDAQFKKIVVARELKENLILVEIPQTGRYWWRVRSFGKGKKSSFSKPRLLLVAP